MAENRQIDKAFAALDKAWEWADANKHRFPALNEDAFKRLEGMRIEQDSPLSILNMRHESDISYVRARCKEAEHKMRNTLLYFAESWANGGKSAHTGKEIDMEQVFTDIIGEQNRALELIKKAHSQNKYPDGAVLDSLGGSVTVIRLDREGSPPVSGEDPPEKFFWTHHFAVLDGELVPLVVFPSEKKKD